ncbi:protein SRC2-like [Diospyros lotus]|uniref:protein SRC2-like n=1 Tax=Diospyros lotus TaxID=55363 RepID=UPI0022555769|nr:protein SRC2-like [Diospyros lotus]
MSSVAGIQDRLLEVTVVGCSKLKDTEWISKQDPYVCLEYGSTKFRTRTCTDGGKNPIFQDKFTFKMIEGLRELDVRVWNSNTVTLDAFIGSGKVQLQKVLTEGYEDSTWPLQTKSGRHAGEVRLILYYGNAKKTATNYVPSAPTYVTPSAPQVPMYSTPPPSAALYSSPAPLYSSPPPANPTQAQYSLPPPGSATYPPPGPYTPPPPAAHPPPYMIPPQYQQQPPYPPPPQAAPFYVPGPHTGMYPPPPY